MALEKLIAMAIKELLVTLFMLVGITYFVFLIIPSIDPKQKLQNMGNKLNNLRMILTLFMSGLAVLFYIAFNKNK